MKREIREAAATKGFLTIAIATLQRNASIWMSSLFGPKGLTLRERGMRIGEETNELMQCCGVTREEAKRLVDQVYDKSVEPNIGVEIGGVFFCLLGLAEVAERNVFDEFMIEWEKCQPEEMRQKILKKWDSKVRSF